MSAKQTAKMMVRYKQWANDLSYAQVMSLPASESLKQRSTRFGTMVHTLNHVFVIDEIFQHHLQGREHGYTDRNTKETPPIDWLWNRVQALDQWYVDEVDRWSDQELTETIHFNFVNGGQGAMTREQIILHVVNHATYHRGFVSDMLYQVPSVPVANDLSVFIRDVYQADIATENTKYVFQGS
jgi:uncharacterized damage-inducible protein DinB